MPELRRLCCKTVRADLSGVIPGDFHTLLEKEQKSDAAEGAVPAAEVDSEAMVL